MVLVEGAITLFTSVVRFNGRIVARADRFNGRHGHVQGLNRQPPEFDFWDRPPTLRRRGHVLFDGFDPFGIRKRFRTRKRKLGAGWEIEYTDDN